MIRSVVVAALLLVAACGSSGTVPIGGACTDKGSSAECVEGAICDTVKDNRVICLKSCGSDADCSSTESCSGVSGGTGKGCHPK